jgi:hypothetical protein
MFGLARQAQWTVGGRHDYQLKPTPGGWRIAGLAFTLQRATGNMNVLTLAMGRTILTATRPARAAVHVAAAVWAADAVLWRR